jgi:hypothetical protein
MPEAHESMKLNPDIGTSILAAIHQVDGEDKVKPNYMAPLNHAIYYQSREEQDSDQTDDNWAMELEIPKKSTRSRSRSRSNSEASENGSDVQSVHSSGSESESFQKSQYHSNEEDL